MFTAASFTKATIWKQPQCPSRQGDKEEAVHTHDGMLFGHMKNEILPFATSHIDLEGVMLSKISQTERDTYFIHMRNIKISKQNRNGFIDTENSRPRGARGEGLRGRAAKVNGRRSRDGPLRIVTGLQPTAVGNCAWGRVGPGPIQPDCFVSRTNV